VVQETLLGNGLSIAAKLHIPKAIVCMIDAQILKLTVQAV